VAQVAFLLNELRDRDPDLALQVEREVEQAVAELEPGERLHCFIFVDPSPGGGGALVRMRVGQMGWYRDLPPVSVNDSPLAVGLALPRMLRRHPRPRERV
jgi:hypothetical protein